MFSEDKAGGGGCWVSIHRMLKREGEYELVFITPQSCCAVQNPSGTVHGNHDVNGTS